MTAEMPDPAEPTAVSHDPRTEITLAEQMGFYVDMWKKSVDVQQHFNDIEWRIRGLALTAATFAIGAAGVAAKDGTKIGSLSLGTLVVVIGLVLWSAFYFVDRYWYHPLLRAAVEQGGKIEAEIKKHLPQAGLTENISARSPESTPKWLTVVTGKSAMHSEDKLKWFYRLGACAFLVAAVALQVGSMIAADRPAKPQQIDVRIIQSAPPPPAAVPGASTATPYVSRS
jgi:nucleotide-binding universal stress UspA family protein